MKKILIFIVIIFTLFMHFCVPAFSAEKKEMSLSLKDISHIALENNFDIQIAKFDAYIKENDALLAESIFDTIISGKITYTDNQSKQASTIFGTKSLTNEYELSAEKKMPTGTTINTSLTQERNWTNSAFATTNPSHEATASIGLTQELGKNFFGLIDRGNIKITKLDIKNSTYTSLDKIEQSLADTQKAYWKLILRNKELLIGKEMLQKAEELLKIHTDKEKIGLLEQPQILASGANLKQRESEVILSQNALDLTHNDILYRLDLDPENITILPSDESLEGISNPDYIESLKLAIQSRRDYAKQKNELDASKIQLSIKKNSLWPEINLEITLSRNGLDSEYREAFGNIVNEDNPRYYTGINFKFPLENRNARGEFNKAKLEKIKQVLKLKNIERKIVVATKDNIAILVALIAVGENSRQVAKLQEEKLIAEERRFRSGRSDTDTIIRYQEDLLQARINLARAEYNIQVAKIDLMLAENSLLNKYWREQI